MICDGVRGSPGSTARSFAHIPSAGTPLPGKRRPLVAPDTSACQPSRGLPSSWLRQTGVPLETRNLAGEDTAVRKITQWSSTGGLAVGLSLALAGCRVPGLGGPAPGPSAGPPVVISQSAKPS